MDFTNTKPAAKWTHDCHGKQDYDGPLVTISCRYYPETGGFMIHNGIDFVDPPLSRPSAFASVLLRHGQDDDYIKISEVKFEADTESEVKALVEDWVQSAFMKIANALLPTFERPHP